MEAKPIPVTAKNMLLMRIDRVVFIARDLRVASTRLARGIVSLRK
jgi:hypothetical protein